MSRFVLLELGDELGPATEDALRRASAPVPLRLLDPPAPFREDQIVHVQPVPDAAVGARAILLCRAAAGYRLHGVGEAAAADGEVLGRVVAIERGPIVLRLDRGILSCLPAAWLTRVIDGLEVLARFRHPLTPPLFQGTAEDSLVGVRDKYSRAAEVRAYSRIAEVGSEALELETVQRYVKPGGRLLDIGCGAGREALGFARGGFRVTAIDIAPGMIVAARVNAERAGLAIDFRVQSVTELDDPPSSYDGAYLAFSVLHHIAGRARRIDALRRIRQALTTDGTLTLVVAYRGPRGLLSRSRVVDLLRRVAARVPGPWHVSEPGDGYAREVSDASDPRHAVFFHEYAGSREVRTELEAAGFRTQETAPGWWVCQH
jgi:SAM-dependent methyltransferase